MKIKTVDADLLKMSSNLLKKKLGTTTTNKQSKGTLHTY